MKIFIGLIYLPYIFAAKKNYEVQHVISCPGEDNTPLEIHVEVNNTTMIPNRVFISGYVEAKEKVSGPLDLSFEANRCNLKSENCEKYTGLKVLFIY